MPGVLSKVLLDLFFFQISPIRLSPSPVHLCLVHRLRYGLIVEIQRLALRAAILVQCQNYSSKMAALNAKRSTILRKNRGL